MVSLYPNTGSLFCFCFAVTFFISGLIINLTQCVLYLTLYRLDRNLYRKINWYLNYSIHSQLVFVAEWWADLDVILYTDEDDGKKFGMESALCVMNHTYEIDWLIAAITSEKYKVLGNDKLFLKKTLKYLPVVGWHATFNEYIALDRTFEKDKRVIGRQVSKLCEYTDPVWLLLFPEGTRFTSEKHKYSQQFAKENKLPELKYHLTPRTKGFVESVSNMRGKFPVLYDSILAFRTSDAGKIQLANILNGTKVTAHLYVKRIPLEQIPEDGEKANEFLHRLYQEKDRVMDSFVKTDDFFMTSGVKRIQGHRLARRPYPLINFIFWFVVTGIIMTYCLFCLLNNGKSIYSLFALGIIFIVFVLSFTQQMIRVSEIKSASSYGVISSQ